MVTLISVSTSGHPISVSEQHQSLVVMTGMKLNDRAFVQSVQRSLDQLLLELSELSLNMSNVITINQMCCVHH